MRQSCSSTAWSGTALQCTPLFGSSKTNVQWERFLPALGNGIDSMLDHEARFLSYADSDTDNCDSAYEAGALYEGYDNFDAFGGHSAKAQSC